MHRRDRAQIRENRIAILARHLRIGGKRHRRIDQAAIGEAARVHRPIKLVRGPRSDAGCRIWGNIGRIDRAERGGHRKAAGKQHAAGVRVAGDTVAGVGEIFTLGDEVVIPGRRRNSRAAGAGQKGQTWRGRPKAGADRSARRPPQFGSLPQASGIASVPFGTADGSGGTGREASHAATAATSLSLRLAATSCIQSGAAAVRVP